MRPTCSGWAAPLLNLAREYAALRSEIDARVSAVLRSGRVARGPAIERFEREFAEYLGVTAVVMVGSGTAALHAALLAAGVGPGDEVIVPAFTFVGTAEAAIADGATPVVVDVDPETLLMDADAAMRSATERTRAIVPVHLYGRVHPATADLVLAAAAHGIAVVEDACQAHGAHARGRRPGSASAAACYSFYPTKNLGTYGEGGAVATNDPALADRVRAFRNHGRAAGSAHASTGLNLWPGEVEAAVLSAKLPCLDRWNDLRRATARRYDEALAGRRHVRPLRNDGDGGHAYHEYVVRSERRDELRAFLADRGIETAIHYDAALPAVPSMAARVRVPAPCVAAERAAAEVLSLPVHPWLSIEEVNCCVAALRAACDRLDGAG